jgi:hypothetical protein
MKTVEAAGLNIKGRTERDVAKCSFKRGTKNCTRNEGYGFLENAVVVK